MYLGRRCGGTGVVFARKKMNSWDDDDWGDEEGDQEASKSYKRKDIKREKGQFRKRAGERTFTPEDLIGPTAVASAGDDIDIVNTATYRRVIGVDYGKRRTGVAVSVGGLAPRALDVIHDMHGKDLVDRLMEIAEAEGAQEFVVGLPTRSVGRHLEREKNDGLSLDEHPQAKFSRTIARKLATEAKLKGLSVYLYDESYTSADAREMMIVNGSSRKARQTQLDSYSAAVLLQHYFKRTAGEPEEARPFAGGVW